MAAPIGFVYVLVNPYMPGICKVGCTERSPHERAHELSQGSGVPYAFEVLCFIEIRNFQAVERHLHEVLSDYRISSGREFFNCDLTWLVSLMFWYLERLSYCQPQDLRCDHDYQSLVDWEQVVDEHGNSEIECIRVGRYTPNPWLPKDVPAHERLKLVTPASARVRTFDEYLAKHHVDEVST